MNERNPKKISEADIQQVKLELAQLCSHIDTAITVRSKVVVGRIEKLIGELSLHLFALGFALQDSHEEQARALQVLAIVLDTRTRLLCQPNVDRQMTSDTLDRVTGVLEILEGIH